MKKEHFPNQLTVVPRDGEKATAGNEQLTWHAVDTKNYNVNLYHFAYERGQEDDKPTFLGRDDVNCPRELTTFASR